jgi:Domain of unknown function (DUF4129)
MNGHQQTALGWRIRAWPALAVLALLLMETTIVSLWYQALFLQAPAPWPKIFLTLFLILGLSHWIADQMRSHAWRISIRQGLFAVWMVLAIYTSLKLLIFPLVQISLLDMIVLPFRYMLLVDVEGVSFYHMIVISLWVWHGIVLARSPVTLSGTQASFQLGLTILLLYGMVYAPIFPVEATLGLYLFLLLGLIAMSASRISNLSELRGGRMPRFGFGWMISILLAGLILVSLAILMGWLTSGRVAGILAQIFIIILAILTTIVIFIFSPLLVLLAQFIPYLANFLQQLIERLRNLPIFNQIQNLVENLSQGLDKILPFLMAGRGLILLGILVVLVTVILLSLRLKSIRQAMTEEEESGLSKPETGSNLLQRLLQRLWNDARGLRLRSPAQILAAARIRRIYRQLMVLSQKMGTARQPSVTPLEFLPVLDRLFPGEHEGLDLITRAYMKTRYGGYPETHQEVETVEDAWTRVRKKGKLLLNGKDSGQGGPTISKHEHL